MYNINSYKQIEGWCNFENIYQSMVNIHNNATFVEVGTWKGQSAVLMATLIANLNKNIKFYCVDTWEGSEEHSDDKDIKNKNLFDIFLSNTDPYKNYITPIRKTSVEASFDFPNESLDFIFIDAAHDYENVKNDIEAWYPKLKRGGTFAGHDYHETWSGVIKAVNEWTEKNNKFISISNTSWVHFKPSSG